MWPQPQIRVLVGKGLQLQELFCSHGARCADAAAQAAFCLCHGKPSDMCVGLRARAQNSLPAFSIGEDAGVEFIAPICADSAAQASLCACQGKAAGLHVCLLHSLVRSRHLQMLLLASQGLRVCTHALLISAVASCAAAVLMLCR